MKTFTMSISILASMLLLLGARLSSAAEPAAALATTRTAGEEQAVVRALATTVNRTAKWPYDYLYFSSDFPSAAHVASSMSNPDRTDFCGLSRDTAESLVRELRDLDDKPLEFEASTAEFAGLKLGRKKLERFRYLMVSRVVFAPDHSKAWLAIDLNGESGALMRLDKIGGRWQKSARCGGWIRPE
jgi:hypothetical protein